MPAGIPFGFLVQNILERRLQSTIGTCRALQGRHSCLLSRLQAPNFDCSPLTDNRELITRASAHFSFFRDFLPQNREFIWLEVDVTRGLSPRKNAIPRYLRFSQKFVAILEKLPCQFFRFSLKISTEPQNTPLNSMPPKVDPYATPRTAAN